ncbi:MAG: porin family protein [Candidatus Eisenbacteria bacterium]|uniref:Porin family protein n=1 Tax=Eiseniibacteriota bacterium TaxID=2212470 RepID=A0A956NIG5_UNCEI|nr:porin family protein [Candidatus Eisenbacteria bacterium]
MTPRTSPLDSIHRPSPRTTIGALALGLLSLVAGTASAASSGFHVGLGFGAGHLDLSDQLESGLAAGGVTLDPDAGGGYLRAGYTFNPQLQLDLVFSGLDLETGDPDVAAAYGEARLEVLSQFRSEGAVRPYVAGSVGGAFLGIGPDDDDLHELEGSVASFGGGLDFEVSRRWTLGFDYRYGVTSFERKDIDLPLGEVELDGSATSHTWGARFDFNF